MSVTNINQLLIFDLTDTLVAILDPNDEVGPYFDAYYLEQLNGEYTFRFKLPANNDKSEFVVEGNQIAFKDLDGVFQLFEIKIIEEIHEEMIIKDVFCETAVAELQDELIIFQWHRNVNALAALYSALTNTVNGPTRWELGVSTMPLFEYATVRYELINPIQAFKIIVEAFNKGEFQFEVTISGTQITHRYVRILQTRGSNTGKRFEYEKDINSIRREIDFTNVKTALYGFGKAQEVPGGIRRLRFDNVLWTTGSGDPRNKPLGQEYVEDTAALAKWGRDGGTRHRWGFYENPDQTNPETLLVETNAALDQLIEPKISYEMKVVDLERISGLSHEKVRLGDTVTVIDKTFKPELEVTARVIEITRYLNEPEKDEVVLGSFRPLVTDDGLTLRTLNDRVHNNQGVWQDSAYKNNAITDHSFENIPRVFSGSSPDADQVYEVSKIAPPDGDYGSIFWWQWVGTGYVISSYDDVTLLNYNQLALFDYQAAVISTVTGKLSEAKQYIPLNKTVGDLSNGGAYTVSCYVSAFAQTTIDGIAKIQVYACQSDTTRLNSGNPINETGTGEVYLIYTEKDVWKRNIVTITETLPVGTELLEIFLTTPTSQFKYLCDGVQVVPKDLPMTYEPESNLWKMMRRFPGTKLQYPIFLGDITVTGGVQAYKPWTSRAYQSVAQALTAAAYTKITFTTESYDIRGNYDTTNSRFIVPTGGNGFYMVSAAVRLDNPPINGFAGLAIYKNGAILELIDAKATSGVVSIAIQLSGSSIVQLVATDYIEIYVFASAAQNTRAGTDQTHFKVFRLA